MRVDIESVHSQYTLFYPPLQSALIVAFANIEIPLQLGKVVNALTACTRDSVEDFWSLIGVPALKLAGTYAIQVFYT
mgnify:CR=1